MTDMLTILRKCGVPDDPRMTLALFRKYGGATTVAGSTAAADIGEQRGESHTTTPFQRSGLDQYPRKRKRRRDNWSVGKTRIDLGTGDIPMDIENQLSKLEAEILAVQRGTTINKQAELARLEAKVSAVEKAIADEEDDWDGDDSDDGEDYADDDDGGSDSDGNRVRKLDDGPLDHGNDDDPELSTTRNRERLTNRGRPEHYQPIGGPHKFETVVDRMVRESGGKLSKLEAMQQARRENPTLAQAFADSSLSKSYRDLVNAEIDRGFSPLIAKQRVLHAHGNNIAIPDINKGDTPVTRFNAVVTKLMEERGIERTEALRLARKRNPTLFAKYCEV
jgi:hypothetical protein